jgi:hypothetical protein
MQEIKCEGCDELSPGYDIIHYGSMESGYRELCTQCYNGEVAKRCGLADFENIRFEPVGISDSAGETHEFHFRTRLMGHIVALDAFEVRDGIPAGYNFQLVADPDEDLFAMLGRLIQRIRRTLSVKHIMDGKHGRQIIDQTVRGRIEWDDAEEGRLPLVVVDGREISWDDFGELMMGFEGWQFKLEIIDPSDDV